MGTLTRDAEIVGYFIASGGPVGHTRLLKLVYLADLEARRLLGRPLSSWSYRFHNHGPFDPALYTVLKELADAGLVEEKPVVYPDGKLERQVSAAGRIPDDGMSDVERRILAHVQRTCGGLSLNELLRDVYDTPPMKNAVRGRVIPMEEENNASREELGFDLEELVAAQRDAEHGNYLTASEFFDALRAKVTAGRTKES